MTPQDILDELNDHGFTDTSTTRKLAVINDTIFDIVSRQPWPFLEAVLDLTFDGSSATPTNWPTDFRALLTLVNSSTGDKLEWLRLDDIYRRQGNQITLVDVPTNFYFVGKTLKVWPVPPSGTTLHMPYLRKQVAVGASDPESAILIPAEHHRAISLGALYKLYDMEDDFDISQRFQAEYEARLQTMVGELFESQYDRPERVYDIDTDILEYLI